MMRRLIGVNVVFVASFIYFGYLTSPQMSWANAGTDVGDYLMSAKYLMVSHGPGHPTYTIVSRLWLEVLGGMGDVYALSLLSAMSAALASALLYWLSKSIVPSLIYMASMIVVGTATIVDMRAMTILSGLLAYGLHRSGRHTLKYAPLAGIHIFGVFYGLVFVAWDILKEKRPAWRAVIPFGLSLTPYLLLYAGNVPSPWLQDRSLDSWRAYFAYSSGMANGLPIWPPDIAVTRLTDFGALMLASLGAALVPLAYGVRDLLRRGEWLLPVLIALPILYYTTSLTSQPYVYIAFGTPFMALVAYEGMQSVPWRRAAVSAAVLGATMLIAMNAATMSIGRALDPGLMAQRYYEALDTLPDGAAVDTEYRGWELIMLTYYTVSHDGRVDNLWEPGRLSTRQDRTERALREGRLYRTRTVDRVTLATVFEKVQP